MITQKLLKELLHYNPETGEFFWNKRDREHFKSDRSMMSWNTKYAGTTAGTIDGKGYIHISIFKKLYRAHRLAWLYVHNEFPENIDHMNRDKIDNRILNLRPATFKQNAGNSGIHAHNTSGYRGVSLNNKTGKYHAQIKINGKQTYLGRFDNPKEAHAMYVKAAKRHFGEFAYVD
jgi:hypothetical protein